MQPEVAQGPRTMTERFQHEPFLFGLQVISELPEAAVQQGDASVHICFVCLLHLANENGLELTNGGHLDSPLQISLGKNAQQSRHCNEGSLQE